MSFTFNGHVSQPYCRTEGTSVHLLAVVLLKTNPGATICIWVVRNASQTFSNCHSKCSEDSASCQRLHLTGLFHLRILGLTKILL
ncbi:unnamed protein product [Heterobilharzia americana]|nr:unnamed protein product [Heterobilharzia americana]